MHDDSNRHIFTGQHDRTACLLASASVQEATKVYKIIVMRQFAEETGREASCWPLEQCRTAIESVCCHLNRFVPEREFYRAAGLSSVWNGI